MKRAALLLVLLTGACAATPTPTRDELFEALRASGGAPVTSEDLTHIACEAAYDAPQIVGCRWRQRDGRRWEDWQAELGLVTYRKWEIREKPSRRP